MIYMCCLMDLYQIFNNLLFIYVNQEYSVSNQEIIYYNSKYDLYTSNSFLNDSIVNNNEIVDNNIITTSSSVSSNNEYFSTSKLERDTMYSQMLETYEKVLNSNNSLETQKQSASEEITKINNVIASLIKKDDKFFEDDIIEYAKMYNI